MQLAKLIAEAYASGESTRRLHSAISVLLPQILYVSACIPGRNDLVVCTSNLLCDDIEMSLLALDQISCLRSKVPELFPASCATFVPRADRNAALAYLCVPIPPQPHAFFAHLPTSGLVDPADSAIACLVLGLRIDSQSLELVTPISDLVRALAHELPYSAIAAAIRISMLPRQPISRHTWDVTFWQGYESFHRRQSAAPDYSSVQADTIAQAILNGSHFDMQQPLSRSRQHNATQACDPAILYQISDPAEPCLQQGAGRPNAQEAFTTSGVSSEYLADGISPLSSGQAGRELMAQAPDHPAARDSALAVQERILITKRNNDLEKRHQK